MTSSGSGSTGEIQVYFNKSVDTSYAIQGVAALGGVDLSEKAVELIDNANFSIDASLYSFSLQNVKQALIDAHNRGVAVRFIYDDDHNQSAVQDLIDAGITVIDDSFGNNDGSGLQHNKFLVIDARDGSSAGDDYVWTGSFNFTYAGLNDNMQNVIVIQDQALAKTYTMEFNEMWGSAGDEPDPTQSRFGANKTDNTPHIFKINGIWIEQYMSPSDGVKEKFVKNIQEAEMGIYFAVFTFTLDDISNAIYERFNTVPDYNVHGIFDSGQSGASGSEWSFMSSWADVYTDTEPGILHHKYMIVDPFWDYLDPVVITGSYNWTNAAENSNNENVIIIHDASIASLFLQEMAARYEAAAGQPLPVPEVSIEPDESTIPEEFTLFQNYPNPFNRTTTIRFEIPTAESVELSLFDIQGREIFSRKFGGLKPGRYEFEWSALDKDKKMVSSGIYFYRLKTEQFVDIRSMVFLK
jgi:hypothetical protein